MYRNGKLQEFIGMATRVQSALQTKRKKKDFEMKTDRFLSPLQKKKRGDDYQLKTGKFQSPLQTKKIEKKFQLTGVTENAQPERRKEDKGGKDRRAGDKGPKTPNYAKINAKARLEQIKANTAQRVAIANKVTAQRKQQTQAEHKARRGAHRKSTVALKKGEKAEVKAATQQEQNRLKRIKREAAARTRDANRALSYSSKSK